MGQLIKNQNKERGGRYFIFKSEGLEGRPLYAIVDYIRFRKYKVISKATLCFTEDELIADEITLALACLDSIKRVDKQLKRHNRGKGGLNP